MTAVPTADGPEPTAPRLTTPPAGAREEPVSPRVAQVASMPFDEVEDEPLASAVIRSASAICSEGSIPVGPDVTLPPTHGRRAYVEAEVDDIAASAAEADVEMFFTTLCHDLARTLAQRLQHEFVTRLRAERAAIEKKRDIEFERLQVRFRDVVARLAEQHLSRQQPSPRSPLPPGPRVRVCENGAGSPSRASTDSARGQSENTMEHSDTMATVVPQTSQATLFHGIARLDDPSDEGEQEEQEAPSEEHHVQPQPQEPLQQRHVDATRSEEPRPAEAHLPGRMLLRPASPVRSPAPSPALRAHTPAPVMRPLAGAPYVCAATVPSAPVTTVGVVWPGDLGGQRPSVPYGGTASVATTPRPRAHSPVQQPSVRYVTPVQRGPGSPVRGTLTATQPAVPVAAQPPPMTTAALLASMVSPRMHRLGGSMCMAPMSSSCRSTPCTSAVPSAMGSLALPMAPFAHPPVVIHAAASTPSGLPSPRLGALSPMARGRLLPAPASPGVSVDIAPSVPSSEGGSSLVQPGGVVHERRASARRAASSRGPPRPAPGEEAAPS